MPEYIVTGPFVVPVIKKAVGRRVDKTELPTFWNETGIVCKSAGCYVFGMRAGGGISPIYVGKTTKTFYQECFQPQKIEKYNDALSDAIRGKPVMFFVCLKGKDRNGSISDVEQYLIDIALAKNPNIRNIKGTKGPDWSIKGVIRSGKGAATKQSKIFKGMMGVK